MGYLPYQLVQDFFHQQYEYIPGTQMGPLVLLGKGRVFLGGWSSRIEVIGAPGIYIIIYYIYIYLYLNRPLCSYWVATVWLAAAKACPSTYRPKTPDDSQLGGKGEAFKPWFNVDVSKNLIRLKEETLHQLRLVVYPFIYRVSYMSGGAGFLLSTVLTQQTI